MDYCLAVYALVLRACCLCLLLLLFRLCQCYLLHSRITHPARYLSVLGLQQLLFLAYRHRHREYCALLWLGNNRIPFKRGRDGERDRESPLVLVYKLRVRLHVLQLQIVCTAYIKRAKSDIVQVTHIGTDPSYPREREREREMEKDPQGQRDKMHYACSPDKLAWNGDYHVNNVRE